MTSFGSVTVLDSGGATVTRDVFRSGNEIIVSLSNLGDNKCVTLSATNVNAVGVNVSVSVGFLVGDMNSSKAINASDINAVKAHLNQGVNINTAKFNVSLSGAISAAEVSAVKVRSGTVLK